MRARKLCVCGMVMGSLVVGLLSVSTVLAAEDAARVLPFAERVKALDKQLYTGKDAVKVDPKDLAVINEADKALAAALPNPGLKVGEKAPNFALKNPHGKTVKLDEMLKKGPVILVFYRGAWCPYCNLELHALNEKLPLFKKYGASLIAITPQTPDKSLEQLNKDGYPFEILSDLDNKVMKDYKLFWEVSPELDAAYKHSFGLDVAAFNGKGRRGLPVPGTFVIDKAGIVRSAFADTNYKKRMEPAEILKVVQDLSRETSHR